MQRKSDNSLLRRCTLETCSCSCVSLKHGHAISFFAHMLRNSGWQLAQDWAPCAIGMLPCVRSPTGRAPSLVLPSSAQQGPMAQAGSALQPHAGTLKEEQCFDLARLWMAFNLKVIVRTIICDETFCSTNVSSIQSSRFKM